MRAIMTMERRLQDLERFIQNMHRAGDVTDVKYDQERHRWYIKMQDGEGDNLAFKSDWLPWNRSRTARSRARFRPGKA
jgi:phage baseplate assembly protein gpV